MPHTKSCPKSYENIYPKAYQNLAQNLSAKSPYIRIFSLTTLFMLNNAFGNQTSNSIVSPPPR